MCEWDTVDGATTGDLLFTDNESNLKVLYGSESDGKLVKDAFHRYVVNGEKDAVSAKPWGTKVAAHHVITVPAGGKSVVRVRLYQHDHAPKRNAFADFDEILQKRKNETDEFYSQVSVCWLSHYNEGGSFEPDGKTIDRFFCGCHSETFEGRQIFSSDHRASNPFWLRGDYWRFSATFYRQPGFGFFEPRIVAWDLAHSAFWAIPFFLS